MKRAVWFRASSLIFLSLILYALPAYAAWAPAGLEGQDVLALAEDPTATTTWYAGIASGAIYKFTESNPQWVLLSTGLPVGYEVLSISIDPVSPTIIYAGLDGAGVYKTVDGGLNWIYSGLNGFAVKSIELSPNNPAIIFAGTDNGIYKSAHSGANWNSVLPVLSIKKISIDPTQPDIVYAATYDGLYKTTDGGDNWNRINTEGSGIVSTRFSTVIIVFNQPSTLYLGTTDSGIYKSTDSGATWTASSNGITYQNIISLTLYPKNPSIILAVVSPPNELQLPDEIYRTDTAGLKWYSWNEGNTASKTRTITFQTPQATYILAGTSNGVISYDITLPDLVITSLSGPTTGKTGGTITVNNTVATFGGSAGGFVIAFYLSPDNVVIGDNADICIGTRYVSGLASGASNTDNTTLTLPLGLANGSTYYISAFADRDCGNHEGVPESSETNNGLAGNQITITSP